MVFPKDLITALKNLFTKAETFLEPYFKQLTSELTSDILALAATTVASIAANPALLTDPTARNAMIQQLIQTAEQDGIKLAESTASAAIAAAIAHMQANSSN